MTPERSFAARWGTFFAFALSGAGGCSLEDTPAPNAPAGDEQAELQALLADGELTRLGAAAQGVQHQERALARPQVVLPDGGAVPPPPTERIRFGSWELEDCTPFRTQLFDSTFNQNTAYRSVAVGCTQGILGQGVAIAAPEDIVYVPDQPSFVFDQGVTVAGWFKPTQVGGTRTLIRKRDKGTSSFALLLNQGKFQFVISLGGGVAVSVTAPARARANVFQHVAGTYDGQTLRLYVGGVEVSSFAVPGTIPPGPGPLLIGNDGSERRMNGVIDNVIFEGRAINAAEVLELTCFRVPPTVTVTPRVSPPTPAGSPATYDVAITNNNAPSCPASVYTLQAFSSSSRVVVQPSFPPGQSEPVASGAITHMTVTATPAIDLEPTTELVFLQVTDADFFFSDVVQLVVTEPAGCHVSKPRELMITDVSVVDDPVRTSGDGPWSFKHLMEAMAPSPALAPAMVETMLRHFTVDTTLNGLTAAPRPGMESIILAAWPRTTAGELDLAQAPLRLQAIVNRFDLRDLDAGNAGEGRFVFAFESSGFPLEATMILEYKLPASTEAEVAQWAADIHALPSSFGEPYNAALAALTERFARRGARPAALNGSALEVLRTNEISFGNNGLWELREFRLDPSDGFLRQFPVELTPDRSFNDTPQLASWIDDNAAAILDERHVVPMFLDGIAFRGAAVFNDLLTWFAPGVDPEVRHKFALNTCNGCHSTQETGTFFLQISPRFGAGSQAGLSGFLTGTTVSDPVTFEQRSFNDLERRAADLEAVVCATPGARAAGANLRKGISRVH